MDYDMTLKQTFENFLDVSEFTEPWDGTTNERHAWLHAQEEELGVASAATYVEILHLMQNQQMRDALPKIDQFREQVVKLDHFATLLDTVHYRQRYGEALITFLAQRPGLFPPPTSHLIEQLLAQLGDRVKIVRMDDDGEETQVGGYL